MHLAAWQHAYRGLLPDEVLAGLDVVRWRARWESSLAAAAAPGSGTLLAETAGRLVGFVDVVPSRDQDAASGTAEVTSLYVAPDLWGRGAGQVLLEAAVQLARAAGHGITTLWVLQENVRARRFYERAGWQVDGAEKKAVVLGVPVIEVRYRRVT
jgi:GNAT superfamily N-acetyltransferase